jgi:hypothetical protein
MHAVTETVVMLALFNLGGGEIILILALVLILVQKITKETKRFPER